MDLNYLTADERENLYDEVWKEPVSIVVTRYGMSDTTLRKRCQKLNIPLPSRGYWAKIKEGKKVSKTALPEVKGELKKYIRNYAIKYRLDLENLRDEEILMKEDLHLLRGETKQLIQEECNKTFVKRQLRNPHRLIEEHKASWKLREKNKKSKVIETNKYRYTIIDDSATKGILPIYVSKCNINRAYRILDELIKVLEELEGSVHTVFREGKDKGSFLILRRVEFWFELKEHKEKIVKGINLDENSIPKLVLTLEPKSWFTSNRHEIMQYVDREDSLLEEQLGYIIYDIFVSANNIYGLDILKDREEKRKRDEELRLKRLEEMRRGELEEIKVLEQVSLDWEKAERMRRFIQQMELKANNMKDIGEQERTLEWIEWAKKKVKWIDPLIECRDELLGESKTVFQMIEVREIK